MGQGKANIKTGQKNKELNHVKQKTLKNPKIRICLTFTFTSAAAMFIEPLGARKSDLFTIKILLFYMQGGR